MQVVAMEASPALPVAVGGDAGRFRPAVVKEEDESVLLDGTFDFLSDDTVLEEEEEDPCGDSGGGTFLVEVLVVVLFFLRLLLLEGSNDGDLCVRGFLGAGASSLSRFS
mmetsp:Transcript_696/g.825  ORF Transcript_696/g.825 Transcript_696/m.825 type:complete len:109 (-) Transcript_696:40-366(-)